MAFRVVLTLILLFLIGVLSTPRRVHRQSGGRVRLQRRPGQEQFVRVAPTSETQFPEVSPTEDPWIRRERERRLRIFMIQRHILQALGLRRQPNMTSDVLSKRNLKMLQNLYTLTANETNQPTRNVYTDYYAKRMHSIVASCNRPRKTDNSWESDSEYRLYFVVLSSDTPNPTTTTNVSAATLYLYKNPWRGNDRVRHVRSSSSSSSSDDDDDDDDYDSSEADMLRVKVYRYTRAVRNGRTARRTLLVSLLVPKEKAGWVKIDIVNAVRLWYRHPRRNYGMIIEVTDGNNRRYNAFDVFHTVNCSAMNESRLMLVPLNPLANDNDTLPYDPEVTYPSLGILTYNAPNEEARHRRKRNLADKQTCRKEKIYLSFAELGWSDWIIQPLGFETAFCRGTCTTRVCSGCSAASDGKSFYRSFHKTKMMYQECCGPSKLRSLSVLHYDAQGNLGISIIEDFIIAECGCRP